MLQKCKIALRITTSDFDSEINDLINSCVDELARSGIDRSTSGYMYEKCIITYVKRDFGWNNEDYDKLNESYNSQKIFLINSKVEENE